MTDGTADLLLTARDGTPVAATRFDPALPARRAVVIAGAMGVPQRFYHALARDLATRGMAVLTFDYRGIARSLRPPLRAERGRLHDWGEQDLAAALHEARVAWPDLPLAIVAHSVGGQLGGMAAGFDRVDRMLTVASQSGHWRLWPGLGRYAMWWVWHVAVPLSTAVAGFLPMRALGMGENVPREVARDWARAGRDRDYLWGTLRDRPSMAGYAAWRGRLRAIDVADDSFAPGPAVDALTRYYPNASVERLTVHPQAIGRRKLGHFGAFRDTVRETVWHDWADWLLAP